MFKIEPRYQLTCDECGATSPKIVESQVLDYVKCAGWLLTQGLYSPEHPPEDVDVNEFPPSLHVIATCVHHCISCRDTRLSYGYKALQDS